MVSSLCLEMNLSDLVMSALDQTDSFSRHSADTEHSSSFWVMSAPNNTPNGCWMLHIVNTQMGVDIMHSASILSPCPRSSTLARVHSGTRARGEGAPHKEEKKRWSGKKGAAGTRTHADKMWSLPARMSFPFDHSDEFLAPYVICIVMFIASDEHAIKSLRYSNDLHMLEHWKTVLFH